MRQISPHIWTWSEFNTDKGLDFNGWYIQYDGETALIDPPEPTENVIQFIKTRGAPDNIFLTNKHHARASGVFREIFDCPVWIHEHDESLIEMPVDRTIKDQDILSCGIKAIHICDGKTRGETSFYFPHEKAAMIIGDAVIGKPKGSLSMLADEKFENPFKAKLALNRLLEFQFDLLLLGDGESLTENAYETLKKFLTNA
ncbi:MAG: hypothetical protein KDD48_03755 [Bdellovibrionales bacterium]|nr:hypothetical protein [Bdellovibrionales bacterium]